jgi:hypothetical protein
VIVSQEVSLLDAVQVRLWFDELTVIVPFDSEAGALTLLGLSEIAPPVGWLAWLMLTVCGEPPDAVIVTVADRPVPLFAAADHCTAPLPAPDTPDVIVSHA